jgi:hypothetical protein
MCAPIFMLLVLLTPAPADAWGFDVHRFIMDRAIALLPADVRSIFERHRAVAVERTVDPDLWISLGGFADEAPRHFLNLDAYGAFPFRELPRDYGAAVARYGESRVRRDGTLPWRAQEFHARLRSAFDNVRRSAAAESEAVRVAAALSHYVADAHVPLHAISDYDGRQRNQDGVHARFETALFARFGPRLAVTAAPRPAIRSARDAVFDALLESARIAPAVLAADRAAARGGRVYDDTYFEEFFRLVRPTLERRLADSMAVVAASIHGAWQPERP